MVWVLFTALMAVYAAYSANVVVLLQAPSSSIRTLEQLARSKMTVAAHEVDYNHFVFKVSLYSQVREHDIFHLFESFPRVGIS